MNTAWTDEGLDPERAQRDLVARLRASGVLFTPRVVDAFLRVPRRAFVPVMEANRAHWDEPLPIGFGQTISQPTIVAMMTEALRLEGDERVLEIGTGSGYQAAILSQLCAEVFSVERVIPLAKTARETLHRLGYAVHVRTGDGHLGWPEAAPFDRIVLTAAPNEIPATLVDQLADDGMLVAPIGVEPWRQELVRAHKIDGRLETETICPVRFVPMLPGVVGPDPRF